MWANHLQAYRRRRKEFLAWPEWRRTTYFMNRMVVNCRRRQATLINNLSEALKWTRTTSIPFHGPSMVELPHGAAFCSSRQKAAVPPMDACLRMQRCLSEAENRRKVTLAPVPRRSCSGPWGTWRACVRERKTSLDVSPSHGVSHRHDLSSSSRPSRCLAVHGQDPLPPSRSRRRVERGRGGIFFPPVVVPPRRASLLGARGSGQVGCDPRGPGKAPQVLPWPTLPWRLHSVPWSFDHLDMGISALLFKASVVRPSRRVSCSHY
jgi:hypothetical protein